MANSSSSSLGVVGFTDPAGLRADLLVILFIALKLTGKIDWSWWWVLSPLWIGAGFGFVLLILVAIIE